LQDRAHGASPEGEWSGRFYYDEFLKSVCLRAEFSLALAADEPLILFPMFACFDQRGRLYVPES
jgi:hypothetical protein